MIRLNGMRPLVLRFVRLTFVLGLAGLAACGSVVKRDGPPPRDIDVTGVPDALPKPEPRSRYGNPASYEVFGKRYYTLSSSEGFAEQGIASWYGSKFHGRRTSSGETYDMYKMTAAHRTLPLPTYVEVKNLSNSRVAVVKVNDRGPFHDNRTIDLSYAAAKKLGIVTAGTALVSVRALQPGVSPVAVAPVRTVSPGPLPVATPVWGGRFYLQFGAFRDRANAERLRTRIATVIDELVRIDAASSDGWTIHRVRVGPLGSVSIADRLVAALAEAGIREHLVVVP